ncbi:MAG: hypothetical protein ACE1Z8_02640 [Candidatus Acidiferrales bacterium]
MSSRVFLLGLLISAVAACSAVPGEETTALASTSAAETARVYDFSWSRDPLWDDGRAEVALYDARRPQYGKVESYQAVFIVVKEDFNRQHYVKADPPFEGKDTFPVLKLNAVHSYWTDNYPYHFMESVFVRRDDPTALVKLTLGSQEWCGNTFKEVTTWGATPQLISHSYFDGQGDASRPLDLRPGDLLEDQLPLVLRSLRFEPGLEFKRRLLPSLISNSLRRTPEFVQATIGVVGEEMVETGAGRLAAWKVRIAWEKIEQTWWFEKTAPHTLLKMESSDGRSWVLRERMRKAYWGEPTYQPKM